MFAFEDERIDFSFPNSEPSLIKELKKATKRKGNQHWNTLVNEQKKSLYIRIKYTFGEG